MKEIRVNLKILLQRKVVTGPSYRLPDKFRFCYIVKSAWAFHNAALFRAIPAGMHRREESAGPGIRTGFVPQWPMYRLPGRDIRN